MANKQSVARASLDAIYTDDGEPIKNYFASADVSDKFGQVQEALNEVINEYDDKFETMEKSISDSAASINDLTTAYSTMKKGISEAFLAVGDKITALEESSSSAVEEMPVISLRLTYFKYVSEFKERGLAASMTDADGNSFDVVVAPTEYTYASLDDAFGFYFSISYAGSIYEDIDGLTALASKLKELGFETFETEVSCDGLRFSLSVADETATLASVPNNAAHVVTSEGCNGLIMDVWQYPYGTNKVVKDVYYYNAIKK